MKKRSFNWMLLPVMTLAIMLAVQLGAQAQDNAPKFSPSPTVITCPNPGAYTASYTLTVTAPSALNKTGEDKLASDGIVATLTATQSDPLALVPEVTVTFDPPTLTFTALNQSKTVNVTVTVDEIDAAGLYTLKIKADAPGRYGWGQGAGGDLVVDVCAPQEGGDTTPPNITPIPTIVNCLGPVPIAIEAADGESPITAITASVNGTEIALEITGLGTGSATATGTFTPALIGVYTLTVTATSAGGTAEVTADITINYSSAWLPPLSLNKTNSKGGSTIPVKFNIQGCDGKFVRDESVVVWVYETSTSGDIQRMKGAFGEGASAVRIAGQTGDDTGQYILNFQTASGARAYRVDVTFAGILDNALADVLQESKAFSVVK